jgi:hypothetical protein
MHGCLWLSRVVAHLQMRYLVLARLHISRSIISNMLELSAYCSVQYYCDALKLGTPLTHSSSRCSTVCLAVCHRWPTLEKENREVMKLEEAVMVLQSLTLEYN